MRALISIIAWCAFAIAFAQRPSAAPAQTRSVLVKGGTVHVGDGRTFDDGAVGFRNGTIDFVGYEYAVKAAYDTVESMRKASRYIPALFCRMPHWAWWKNPCRACFGR